jgi:hypothetical protein
VGKCCLGEDDPSSEKARQEEIKHACAVGWESLLVRGGRSREQAEEGRSKERRWMKGEGMIEKKNREKKKQIVSQSAQQREERRELN